MMWLMYLIYSTNRLTLLTLHKPVRCIRTLHVNLLGWAVYHKPCPRKGNE